MVRIVPYEKTENRYEDLAKAIVVQAADDYKRCRFVLDTIDMRKYKDEEGKYTAINRAKKEIKSVERFFNSDWFYALSNLNGDFAIKALEETYVNEYYPVRMEEFLDETKNGRYRAWN